MTIPSVVFPNLRHIFQELCRKLPGTSCIISGSIAFYSTVTDFARFRGCSTFFPLQMATW